LIEDAIAPRVNFRAFIVTAASKHAVFGVHHRNFKNVHTSMNYLALALHRSGSAARVVALRPLRADVDEALRLALRRSGPLSAQAMIASVFLSRTAPVTHVAPSSVGGASGGRGLFASVMCDIGDVISIYPGALHETEEAYNVDGSYTLARADGIVIDAEAVAPAPALAALLARRTVWANGHMAQHGIPNATYQFCNFEVNDALPYSRVAGGSRNDLPRWLGKWSKPSPPEVPGAVLIALGKLQVGDEIFCDYRFSSLEAKPAWARRVPPSAEWTAHEEACAAAGIACAKRPCMVDERWLEEVSAADDARAARAQTTPTRG
jgi:hypothetical protein